MKTRYNTKWYRPMEIVKLGLIKNSRGDAASLNGNYNFVLQLIRTGKLAAKNYSTGTGKRPYWLVSEDAINHYHMKVDNV